MTTTTIRVGDIVELDGEYYRVARDACNLSPYMQEVKLPTAPGIYTIAKTGRSGEMRALLSTRGTWSWLDMSASTLKPVPDDFAQAWAHRLTLAHPYEEDRA